MPVSKRSKRNQNRREMINHGHPDGKMRRSARYEDQKRDKSESMTRKQERIKKGREKRKTFNMFTRRGVL